MSERTYFAPPDRHWYFLRQLMGELDPEVDGARQEAAALIRAISGDIAASPDDDEIEEILQHGVPLLQSSLIAAWQDDIVGYEALALRDFERDSRDFAQLMTRGDTNLFRDGTIATHFNWSHAEFTAQVAPSPEHGLDELRIYLAGGVMRSLDDLFFRAFCNKDLFSWSITDNATHWDGCDCYFAARQAGALKPMIRYWDYRPDMSGFMEGALSGESPFLGVVSNYYSGVPVGDGERIAAASLASTIGFYWVYAHEVGHYRRGHFHVLAEHPQWFGIDAGAADGIEHLWMLEGGDRHSAIADDALSRQIEWDADRVAAESMVDIFFHPDQAGKLPGYCDHKARWLLRLLILSMVGAALLLDRIAQLRGASSQHPSGLARVIGIIIAACRRFDQTVDDTAISDSEIKAFTGIGSREDAVAFASDVVMEVLQDCLVIAEILENETVEGVVGSGYQFPLGDEEGAVAYVHYMTLTTMFKPPLTAAFDHLREAARPPTGRWSAEVFAEVRGYLDREADHALSAALDRYTSELHRMHELKLAALRAR